MTRFTKLDPEHFFLSEINHDELRALLFDELKSARFSKKNGIRMILYQIPDTEHELQIELTSQETINSISLSTKFPNSTLQQLLLRIKESLIDNQIPAYNQSIGFTSGARINGVFRYKDVFQIIPVPEYASGTIRFDQMLSVDGLYPLLLQFSFISSSDHWISYRRIRQKETTWFRLINILLRDRFFSEHNNLNSGWVLEGSDWKTHHSTWKSLGYRYPNFTNHITEFSDSKVFAPLKRTPAKDYYAPTRIFRMAVDPLNIPDDLEKSLDLVTNLDDGQREKFDRACNWFSFAEQFRSQSKSASFASMVVALESLINKPEKCPKCSQTLTESLGRCDACGQPMYRLNASFKKFLNDHVPFIKEMPEAQKLLYSVRSQLVHGLNLFTADLDPYSFRGHQQLQDSDLHEKLHLITIVATHHWLRTNLGES